MNPQTDSRWTSRWLSLSGLLIRAYVESVGRTWRTEVVQGRDVLDGIRSGGRPVIFTFWHNRSALAIPFFLRSLHRQGHPVSILLSGSRDGEVVARAVSRWDVEVARGSATRGGHEALWGTYRAIRRSGTSPIVVPDGPTGPIYAYKAGVLHLARLSGAPVVPVGLAASRYRTLRSWDRLMIPSAPCRIAVALGRPRTVPRVMDADSLERERQDRESELTQLTARAEAEVGRDGSVALPAS